MRSCARHRGKPAVAVVVAAMALISFGCGSDGEQAAEVASEEPAATTEAPDTGVSGTGVSGTEAPDAQGDSDRASEPESESPAGELFPDVVGANAERHADGSWTFSATLSSPYDTPQRYADAWRVIGPDGTVYGIRELAHDHAGEQPFTRSQSGIAIPPEVTSVTVQGRDQVSGWGGATVEVDLDP